MNMNWHIHCDARGIPKKLYLYKTIWSCYVFHKTMVLKSSVETVQRGNVRCCNRDRFYNKGLSWTAYILISTFIELQDQLSFSYRLKVKCRKTRVSCCSTVMQRKQIINRRKNSNNEKIIKTGAKKDVLTSPQIFRT